VPSSWGGTRFKTCDSHFGFASPIISCLVPFLIFYKRIFGMKHRLNPKLFRDHELRDEVAVKLLEICEAFIKFAGIPNNAVFDCVLTGSNAAYNWTRHSDLDLHIIYIPEEMNGFGENLERYLLTMKQLFNLQHDIRLRGVKV